MKSGFRLDHLAERRRVQHVDGVTAVRHLHRRSVVITVDRDDFDAEALHFDDHFLAQFARTEHQHLDRALRQSSSQFRHDVIPPAVVSRIKNRHG